MTIKGKDLLKQIQDKEFNKDILAELEKFEIKKPKTVYQLKANDELWIVKWRNDGYVFADIDTWFDEPYQNFYRELGFVHLSKERATEHARVMNTERKIKEFKRLNDNVELDWEDISQTKHYLYFDQDNVSVFTSLFLKYANTIFMSSKELWKQCIEELGKERIIEWIKWEDNDQ